MIFKIYKILRIIFFIFFLVISIYSLKFYEGSIFVFAIYCLSFIAMLYYLTDNKSSYFEVFFSSYLFLGFWFKYVFSLILYDGKIYDSGQIKSTDIDEVLIAMPSQSKTSLRSILNEVEEYPVKVRILPGVAELAQGKIGISELKEVDIEDLLGREEVLADKRLFERQVKQKIV